MTPEAKLESKLEFFRLTARRRIELVIAHHAGQPEFDVLMSIGKCCTAKTKPEHRIWNEEARLAIAANEATKGEPWTSGR